MHDTKRHPTRRQFVLQGGTLLGAGLATVAQAGATAPAPIPSDTATLALLAQLHRSLLAALEQERLDEEMQPLNLALIEQPTPDGDFSGLARLRSTTQVPVMADDMVFDLVDAEELIRHKACDVISVYPGKNGGTGEVAADCRVRRPARGGLQHWVEPGVGCGDGGDGAPGGGLRQHAGREVARRHAGTRVPRNPAGHHPARDRGAPRDALRSARAGN